MAKYAVIVETPEEPRGEQYIKEILEDALLGEVYKIHKVYAETYDGDYNMWKYRCLPPLGDPQLTPRYQQIGWQINGGPNNGLVVSVITDAHKDAPHGGFTPVYVEVGD